MMRAEFSRQHATTESSDVPEWLYVGAKVVEYTARHGMASGSIIGTEVAKIGKRDVVLTNGHRYNVRHLSKRRGAWDSPQLLIPADDARVEEVRQANLRNRRIAKAERAYDAWRRSRSNEDATALIEALKETITDA